MRLLGLGEQRLETRLTEMVVGGKRVRQGPFSLTAKEIQSVSPHSLSVPGLASTGPPKA